MNQSVTVLHLHEQSGNYQVTPLAIPLGGHLPTPFAGLGTQGSIQMRLKGLTQI